MELKIQSSKHFEKIQQIQHALHLRHWALQKKLGHQHVHVASNHKYRPENAFEAHAMSTSANNCKNHRITGLLELPINGGNWHAMPEYSLEHPCKKHLL